MTQLFRKDGWGQEICTEMLNSDPEKRDRRFSGIKVGDRSSRPGLAAEKEIYLTTSEKYDTLQELDF